MYVLFSSVKKLPLFTTQTTQRIDNMLRDAFIQNFYHVTYPYITQIEINMTLNATF
jgi:hypothetical protein